MKQSFGLATAGHLREMSAGIRKAFDTVKSELEDHRESINGNTNELQSIYEYMCELDSKIHKMNERIDEVQMLVQGKPEQRSEIKPLSLREKEVALVLYMEDDPQTVDYIARRTGLTSDLVRGYIQNLVSKGVPVINVGSSFSLEDGFKRLQATENILQVNEVISQGLQY